MGYIDIHAHIIPDIDDGPKTLEQSKQMLKSAYEQGFTTIVATPHCSKGFRKYSIEDVVNQCSILDEYAKEHIFSDFSVLAGQEIYYNEDSLKLICARDVIPLADSNYILLEFEPDISFSRMLRALREVSMTPYFVVLAHVERYACLYDLKKLQRIRDMGILIQMNYSGIAGKWYDQTTTFCRKCLKHRLVDFLGTDMHDVKSKDRKFKNALRWMQRNLNPDYIKLITKSNAQKIIIHMK